MTDGVAAAATTHADLDADLHALEAAAFRAWPALASEALHGWHLRFARGYTRRANSANATPATAAAGDAAAADVRAIEARFAERGLPPVFRLVSFGAAPTFDDTLAGRGYRFLDLSLVMVAPLDGAARSDGDDAPPPRVTDDAAAWLGQYRAITGAAGADQETHLRMLRAIPARTAFATAGHPGAGGDAGAPAAACALGVLDGDALGLFDIATRPDARRQGHAGRLCAGLMRWARGEGARRAYLQVLASNHDAIALYERLGFRRAYHYWYRVAG